jgi:transmembrane sensor
LDVDISDEVVMADAAAWMARLQRADRTPATEAAFREWLGDPAHATAFARIADLWDIIPGGVEAREERNDSRRWPLRPVIAVGMLVTIALGSALYLTRNPGYRTAIGQQQVLTLSDETRVALNTDSRLTIDYSSQERRVNLERGEALFEVTKNANRAFIVAAGDVEVRALGTKFDVRRSSGRVIVVLLEGKVEITRRAEALARPVRVATLNPGERVTIGRGSEKAALDHPNLETATAWRRGEVMFEDATLSEAVAEMNRYARVPVELATPELEHLRVSGVFESQSTDEFVESIAALHHLSVERRENAVILTASRAVR